MKPKPVTPPKEDMKDQNQYTKKESCGNSRFFRYIIIFRINDDECICYLERKEKI